MVSGKVSRRGMSRALSSRGFRGRDHLRPLADNKRSGHDFDFTGATFDGGDSPAWSSPAARSPSNGRIFPAAGSPGTDKIFEGGQNRPSDDGFRTGSNSLNFRSRLHRCQKPSAHRQARPLRRAPFADPQLVTDLSTDGHVVSRRRGGTLRGGGQGRTRRRITQRHLAICRSRSNPSSSNRLSGPVWK